MESLIISIVMFLFISLGNLASCDVVSRTVTVSNSSKADFTTIQQAIDSVPSNNPAWVKIHIDHGVYVGKVTIPSDKPYIIFEGDPDHLTVIEFGHGGPVDQCSTFTLRASDFVARNIYFKSRIDRPYRSRDENVPNYLHTYDRIRLDVDEKNRTWAVAATILGDRASFYNCTFLSLQDTLWDAGGRHYYTRCYITGAIDFIWGNGQSIYEDCTIRSLADLLGKNISGFITAQGRESSNETTGFVFKNCFVNGTGTSYLGRAYRDFSRVLFFGTNISNVIVSAGWSLWNGHHQNPGLLTYAEENCTGGGSKLAHKSQRVKWEKNLTDVEVRYFTTVSTFINQDGWLEKQPQ